MGSNEQGANNANIQILNATLVTEELKPKSGTVTGARIKTANEKVGALDVPISIGIAEQSGARQPLRNISCQGPAGQLPPTLRLTTADF